MKAQFSHILLLSLLLVAVSSCSTQKNTWMARNYHALTTHYNIKFNGRESYEAGLKQMELGHKEDYSSLLPVFPYNEQSASRATGNMNRCIEKCEKAIKTHSIRVKPEKQPERNASEKEKLFYSQEEFNPVMGRVFLLMAKAQFYKADYLSAGSTCSYIIRHFSTDKPLCDEAKIWLARSYYEQEWYYDAENIFYALNDQGFDPTLNALYATSYADFLLRQERIAQALPYLEIALKNTRKKQEKQRYLFLLAQMHQETGSPAKAYELFKAVPRKNPPYEMALNARIRQTEVYPQGNSRSALKKLKRLSRNPNNQNYLDAIYYAMGNLYFSENDTLKAIDSYNLAIAQSTSNGPYKAQALMTLGDYYYRNELFLEAAPCYQQAKGLIGKEHKETELVEERARVLDLLQPHLETIHLQDSLQWVADLPDEERDKLIEERITQAKKAARQEARLRGQEDALSANRELTQANVREEETAPTVLPGMQNTDDSWYFYNPATLETGRREFQRNWGRRRLEDNWRISNKGDFFSQNAFAGIADETTLPGAATDSLPGDALRGEGLLSDTEVGSTEDERTGPEFEASDDPTQEGYYLKDLPFTREQLQASMELIAEASFMSGMIFREQMGNNDLALRTFQDFEKRFPEDTTYLPEIYYISYLMQMQSGHEQEADSLRSSLLSRFPQTQQAGLLENPHFLDKLKEMYRLQDSLYASTYQHYLNDASDSVKLNCAYVETNYPKSELRPHFWFLSALEAVKAGDAEEFLRLIRLIASEYPNTPLGPVSQQMIGYWEEGRRPVSFKGFFLDSGMTIEDSLAMARLDSLATKFSYRPEEPHILALGYSPDSINENRLLFDVALYNFTNFLIRDYELSLEKIGTQDVLMVRSFENQEDIYRYISTLSFQGEDPQEKYPGLKILIFSESNLELLKEEFPEEVYRRFVETHYP